MIFFDPSVPGWFSCSGTLLDRTTFLTAGHCTFGIGTNGEAEGSSGGNDVWVTFEDTTVLDGFPPRNPANPYPARSDWLKANPITSAERPIPARITTTSRISRKIMTSE